MKRVRPVGLLLCGLLALDILVFIVDSLAGGYRLVIVSSINHPYDYRAGNSARADGGAVAWQPRYGDYTRLSSDTIGKVFYPLIFADQTVWHRDIAATNIESRESLKKRVSLNQIHPEDRKLYDARPLP
jgi:hypothetical protein